MPRRSRVQRHGRLEVECCITIIHSYVRICEEARVEKPSEGRQTQREGREGRGGEGRERGEGERVEERRGPALALALALGICICSIGVESSRCGSGRSRVDPSGCFPLALCAVAR